MAVPIFLWAQGTEEGPACGSPGALPRRTALQFPSPAPKNRSRPLRRPYSVPVTTTVVTPGVTVTAPVVLSWLKAAAGTLKA